MAVGVKPKPRARVTAVYELAAKAAPHLEAFLRDVVSQHVSCTVLEVSSHAEQVQPPDAVEGRAIEPSGGQPPERVDAHEDGELARTPGAGELQSGGGNVDDGLQRDAVPGEEGGDLILE